MDKRKDKWLNVKTDNICVFIVARNENVYVIRFNILKSFWDTRYVYIVKSMTMMASPLFHGSKREGTF